MFESSIFAIAATLYLEILLVCHWLLWEKFLLDYGRWRPEHTDERSHEPAALCHDSIVFLCSDVLSHER